MPRWLQVLLTVAVIAVPGGIGIALLVVAARRGRVDPLSAGELERVGLLIPSVRAKYLRMRLRLAVKGIDVRPGQTRRTAEYQATRVAAGVSTTTESWHEVDQAVDSYPVDPATGTRDLAGRRVDLFKAQSREAEKLGARQLGFWSPKAIAAEPAAWKRAGSPVVWSVRKLRGAKGEFSDLGHLEWREGLTFAQARGRKAAALVASTASRPGLVAARPAPRKSTTRAA